LFFKPYVMFTRAVGVWATRVMRPGRELAAALKEVTDLRDRIAIAEANELTAILALERVRSLYADRMDAGRPLDPDRVQ
jgi:hypothetical protein